MSDPSILKADALVIGGGMVGTAVAIALGGAGLEVVLVDAEPPATQVEAGYDGRSSAIAYGSRQALAMLGIWPGMAAEAEPILDIRVSDGRPGAPAAPLFLHYDHRDSGLDAPFGHIVENRAIRRALAARLAALLPQVMVAAPARLAEVSRQPGHVEARLEDGRRIRARLLIAADGARSKLRRDAGIAAAEFAYGQTGIVCTVAHELPHGGVAHEHFLPAGPFAMLPMTNYKGTDHEGRHRSSIVWTERNARVSALLALDDADFSAEIERRFGDSLGRIAVLGGRWSYPLRLIHAARYADHRRDVAALAEVIADAWRLGLDIGAADVLEDYQRWRRVDSLLLITVTDSLNRLFSNDLAPLRLARDLGLAAVDRLPPLKRLFMRHAMGAAGPRPRLLRGEPL